MNQIELRRVDENLPVERQFSQELQVPFRADFEGIGERLGSESLVRLRALRIHRKPGRMVVVAADRNSGMARHPMDHLVRPRSVIHQVAYAPELVKVPLRKSLQSGQICMNI